MSLSSVRGARATLLLSMGLSFLGICGLFWAYVHVKVSPNDLDTIAAEMTEAQRALTAAQLRSPILQGVQVGNLLASGLLLLSSVLLTARRRSALWWTGQALFANVLYTFANAAGLVWFTYTHADLVSDAEGAPLLIQSAVIGAFAAVLLGIYFVLHRVAARDDVRAFVLREPAE